MAMQPRASTIPPEITNISSVNDIIYKKTAEKLNSAILMQIFINGITSTAFKTNYEHLVSNTLNK